VATINPLSPRRGTQKERRGGGEGGSGKRGGGKVGRTVPVSQRALPLLFKKRGGPSARGEERENMGRPVSEGEKSPRLYFQKVGYAQISSRPVQNEKDGPASAISVEKKKKTKGTSTSAEKGGTFSRKGAGKRGSASLSDRGQCGVGRGESQQKEKRRGEEKEPHLHPRERGRLAARFDPREGRKENLKTKEGGKRPEGGSGGNNEVERGKIVRWEHRPRPRKKNHQGKEEPSGQDKKEDGGWLSSGG